MGISWIGSTCRKGVNIKFNNRQEEVEIWTKAYCNEAYEVSNLGKVRSVRRQVDNGRGHLRWVGGRELRQWTTKNGYLQVETYLDGKMTRHLVHRLVFISFKGDVEYVNHIDEDKTNNALYNLEHSDPIHNANHSLHRVYSLRDPEGNDHTFKTCLDSAKSGDLLLPVWVDYTKVLKSNIEVGQSPTEPIKEITNQWEIDTMNLIDILSYEEGFRAKPYKCSEGYVTIGFGTKLSDNRNIEASDLIITVTREQAKEWLLRDVAKMETKLLASSQSDVFRTLDEDRRAIILSMAYQMGTSGVLRFKKMWKALAVRDWNEAGRQALDSRWARQTPQRAGRHATILAGEETVLSTYRK